MDPQFILAELIAKAQARVELESEQIIKQENSGFAIEHWHVLKALAQNGPMSMGEIHGITAINDSTLTKLVDKLVRNAMVYRRPDEKDRRKIIIYASAKGSDLADLLSQRIMRRQKEFFPDVSVTDLKKMAAVLSEIAR
ncbi:MAG: MarR family winged helix-turn-helix transcriptional regulator [Sphingomonadales bacterium]